MKKQIIATAAVALTATAAFAPAAQADDMPTLGDTVVELASAGFDSDQNNFSIVSNALVATDSEGDFLFPVLVDAAFNNPNLTVFLPTDKAFRILVDDLLDVSIKDEAELFNAIVANVGIPRIGEILAYHVIAGVQADAEFVLGQGDGAELGTVNGNDITLDFNGKKPQVRLADIAGPGRDPIVRGFDVDLGINAVGHVIDRVLIPG